ncbi:MAG: ATP-binding protein [Cryomorphaceae bacterium]
MPKRIFKDRVESALLVLVAILFALITLVGMRIGGHFDDLTHFQINESKKLNVRISVEKIRSAMGEAELAIKAYTLTKDENFLDQFIGQSSKIIDEFDRVYADTLNNDSISLQCLQHLDTIVFRQLKKLEHLVTNTDEYRVSRAMSQVRELVPQPVKTTPKSVVKDDSTKTRWLRKLFKRNPEPKVSDVKKVSRDSLKQIGQQIEHLSVKESQREKEIRETVLAYAEFTKDAFLKIDSISSELASREIALLKTNSDRVEEHVFKAKNLLILGLFMTISLLVISFVLIIYQIRNVKMYTAASRKVSKKSLALAHAKESFVTKITHELRTPLNSIIGFGEIIREVEDEERREDYLGKLIRSANYLRELVNDLLDWSKMNHGKFELEYRNFSTAQLITDISEMSKYRLDDDGPELLIEDCTESEHLFGDDIRLKQIIINLISNSVRFTPEGEVKVSIGENKHNEQETTLEILVKDTGVGIPADKIHLIFGEFEQVDSEGENIQGGTGLGLSIVKWLVDEMNGSIDVQSTEGKGTEVSVRIPVLIGSKPNRSEFSEKIPDLSDFHVLIVDDNSFNLDLLSAILLKTSCRVLRAESGAKALEILKDNQVNLCIFDLRMPHMSGFELMDLIPDEVKSNMKFAALTAAVSPGIESQAMSRGFELILQKPINQNILFSSIRTLVFGSEMEIEKPANQPDQLTMKDAIMTQQLDRIFGDDLAFKDEMLGSFVDHLDEEIKEIRAGIESGDFQQIREAIHKVLPSCRQIGAFHMAEILEELRKQLKHGKSESLERVLKTILLERERIKESIDKLLR